MKKLLLSLLLGLVAIPASASLYNYYQEQGLPLPSISDRASLALQCDISGYRGTYDQNIKLEECLRNNGDFTPELGAALASSDLTQIVADFRSSLAQKLSVGGTTMTLQSVTDDDGVTLASGKYSFTLDGSSSNKEYVICDLNPSTKVCSNIVNISRQGVRTSGAVREHRVGSAVTITDYTSLKYHNDILEGQTGIASTSPLFYIGNPTLTSSTQIATKGYVDNRNGYYEAPVANFAALPTGVNQGEMRVTLDDGKVYTWSGSTWILAGAGGGAGTVYRDDIVATSTNRTYSLSSGSYPDKKYLTVFLNGQLLSEGASADYQASTTGNSITLNFDPVVGEVITLRVESIDFYNAEWTSVNDNLIPDTNNSKDIGSTTKQFKDLYLSGNASVGGILGVTGTTTLATTTISSLTGIPTIPTSTVPSDNQLISLYQLSRLQTTSSTNLQAYATTTEEGNYTTSYALTKSIQLNSFSGNARVDFDLRGTTGAGSTGFGRIYINGVAVGTERSVNVNTYSTFSEQIYYSKGDRIELWVKSDNGINTIGVKNFNIYYDIISSSTFNVINQ